MGLNWIAQPCITLSHHSSKEVQLWRGLQNTDGLARGELAGKVGTGATWQTPAEPQALVESSVPLLLQLWSGMSPPLRPCHIPFHWPHPELSGTLLRSRCTYTTKKSITSQITYCCGRGKLIMWQQELLKTVKVMESGALRAEGSTEGISSEKDGLMFAL